MANESSNGVAQPPKFKDKKPADKTAQIFKYILMVIIVLFAIPILIALLKNVK